MKEIHMLGLSTLAAAAVDGALSCRVTGRATSADLHAVVAKIHTMAQGERLMSAVINATAWSLPQISMVREAVLAAARPIADFRPLSFIVRREDLNEWFAVARQLAAHGLVTGVFIDEDRAWSYAQAQGPLWLADRRWADQAIRPAAAPGRSGHTQPGAPRTT